MSSKVRVGVLALLSVAQLAAAGWSMVRYESTLRYGTEYRIRIEPVDPADAFRGRYVAVRPAITIPAPIALETRQLLERIQSGEKGYVVLATDGDGFARVAEVLAAPPPSGDYLEVASAWPEWRTDRQTGSAPEFAGYLVIFSFNRYYMNEAAAPAAERRFAETVRRNAASRAWITVRVRNGAGVIEGLFIDGVRIEEVDVEAGRK